MRDRDELGRGADGQSAKSGLNGVSPTLIIGIIVVALAVIVFFQNGETTKLDFLFFETENKTRWLVIVSMALGAVADRILGIWWRRRKKQRRDN